MPSAPLRLEHLQVQVIPVETARDSDELADLDAIPHIDRDRAHVTEDDLMPLVGHDPQLPHVRCAVAVVGEVRRVA